MLGLPQEKRSTEAGHLRPETAVVGGCRCHHIVQGPPSCGIIILYPQSWPLACLREGQKPHRRPWGGGGGAPPEAPGPQRHLVVVRDQTPQVRGGHGSKAKVGLCSLPRRPLARLLSSCRICSQESWG